MKDRITIDQAVKQYGSVTICVKAKVQELEKQHGKSTVREGGLNYDYYDFEDGATIRVVCSFGILEFKGGK